MQCRRWLEIRGSPGLLLLLLLRAAHTSSPRPRHSSATHCAHHGLWW
jgi:hypothetical protein